MLLKNDFAWNWAIRIGELVSAFGGWQFSPSSFFCTKNTTKKLIFLCVSVTDMNSLKKAIDFQVFWNSWQFVAASWCTDMEWNYTQKCMLLKRAKIIEKIVILLRVKKPYTIRLTWGGVGPCILIKHPKKESHFDRCTYRGFLFLHLFHCFWKIGVLRVPYVIVFKMKRILYLFWFLEVIFGLTGSLLCNRNRLKSGLLSKFQIFLHIL